MEVPLINLQVTGRGERVASLYYSNTNQYATSQYTYSGDPIGTEFDYRDKDMRLQIDEELTSMQVEGQGSRVTGLFYNNTQQMATANYTYAGEAVTETTAPVDKDLKLIVELVK